MKRLLSIVIFCLCAVFLPVNASAETDINLMSDYRNLLWEGDTLYYNEDHGTVSFKGESGKASITFPTENALGFWFYFDYGNLTNKGTGHVELSFFDESGNVLKSYVSEKNSGNGSFNRYQLGTNEEFVPIPENAMNVQVTLNYDGGEQSPYFRNLSLVLSNNRTVNNLLQGWNISGKLQIVQVGVTRTDHIIWIVFVALVAFGMLAVRKIMDRVKKVK